MPNQYQLGQFYLNDKALGRDYELGGVAVIEQVGGSVASWSGSASLNVVYVLSSGGARQYQLPNFFFNETGTRQFELGGVQVNATAVLGTSATWTGSAAFTPVVGYRAIWTGAGTFFAPQPSVATWAGSGAFAAVFVGQLVGFRGVMNLWSGGTIPFAQPSTSFTTFIGAATFSAVTASAVDWSGSASFNPNFGGVASWIGQGDFFVPTLKSVGGWIVWLRRKGRR